MKVRKLLNAILRTHMTQARTVSLTTAAGTFNVSSCSATLVGNNLRLYFAATAKTAKTAGNITNETMFTITINDDRILGMYSVCGTFGASGPTASVQFTVSGKTITVTLCSIAQNISSGGAVSSYTNIPCVLG